MNFRLINSKQIPDFFYGTAWKEEQTSQLTEDALASGFLAIDTANQRKHYFEEAVGIGIQNFLSKSSIKREQIFIQTKFTYARGQDHRLPYNEKASFTEQVNQSFESSLNHLGVSYIDSYILHGPEMKGISAADREVWQAMEALQRKGKVRFIGVSNVSKNELSELFTFADIKPSFAQIRTYASRGWEKDTRNFCNENGILFQGFSLLTANRHELQSESISALSKKYHKEIPQIIFRFAKQLGIIPLTGTTKKANMLSDLATDDFELTAKEVLEIENLSS